VRESSIRLRELSIRMRGSSIRMRDLVYTGARVVYTDARVVYTDSRIYTDFCRFWTGSGRADTAFCRLRLGFGPFRTRLSRIRTASPPFCTGFDLYRPGLARPGALPPALTEAPWSRSNATDSQAQGPGPDAGILSSATCSIQTRQIACGHSACCPSPSGKNRLTASGVPRSVAALFR